MNKVDNGDDRRVQQHRRASVPQRRRRVWDERVP
jgi:hypothetical protein